MRIINSMEELIKAEQAGKQLELRNTGNLRYEKLYIETAMLGKLKNWVLEDRIRIKPEYITLYEYDSDNASDNASPIWTTQNHKAGILIGKLVYNLTGCSVENAILKEEV